MGQAPMLARVTQQVGRHGLAVLVGPLRGFIGNHFASSPAALQASFFNQLLIFIALIGGATLFYIGLTWLFRCPEIEEVYGIATRRETAEHPFGTLKMRMGATHFLMKTLPRVATEMALHVLAYNLTRVMNIVGIQPLIAAMRA